ncbi:DUF6773 family protein [Solibacillus sp. FSL R5-0449]|uniref:DUF6773 family protein n=1 Tax=Solibacillus sp. FSL R5-0449 TaxID=2921639 RepID=UPI0030CB3D3E
MGFWNKKIVDERVYNTQNKIYREIYILTMIIVIASIAVKFYLSGVSMESVATEMVILICGSLYYGFRSAQLGVFSDEVELHDANSKFSYSTKQLIVGSGLGLVIALFMGINSAYQYADSSSQAIEYFFLVFIVSLMIYVPFYLLLLFGAYKSALNKSQKVNSKMLEEDDDAGRNR